MKMSTIIRLVLATCLIALLIGIASSTAAITSASTVAPLALVSAASPFANCTIGGPGTAYTNAEVEPWVAVNPTSKGRRINLIGAWQQDRWNNGGARGLIAGYSFDGGQTWGRTPLPFSACAPGGLSYERATDPWVSVGPDGTAYAVSVSFNQSNNDNAIAAAASTDGGKTWGNLRVVKADDGQFQFFNDKEAVTADPTRPGYAYVVWDRLESPTDNPYVFVHNVFAFKGPTWFAKTTDGGNTWSQPKIIVPTAERQQTIGNQIVVDPRNGTLYNFMNLILATGPNGRQGLHGYNVAFQRSTDAGETWSAPQIIEELLAVGVTHPNTGQSIRTGDITPEPAIDPVTGRLYVVWQDARFNGFQYDEVAISTSGDGGATWSAPARVNTPTGRPAFTPAINVNSVGVVGVTHYDFRNLTTQTTTLPTDYWFLTSTNNGASFGNEAHIAGSFDMLTAPYAAGFFLGDYEGLTSTETTFYPFFVQTNSGNTANRTDVFSTNIAP